MIQALITLRHLNESHPVTVGEFRWSEDHGQHLMQGRPFTLEEFNKFAASQEWDRTIDRYGERLKIELREQIDTPITETQESDIEATSVTIQSQEGQTVKSLGSYPGVAGSIPAPATILLDEAKLANPPKPKATRKRAKPDPNRGK